MEWESELAGTEQRNIFLGNLAEETYLGRAELSRLRAEKKVELDENSAVTAEKLD